MSIQTIAAHATRIKRGNARVKPGQPYRINEAASVGDGVWQGDLGIEIVEGAPEAYRRRDTVPQLVPGNTKGSRHVLADVSTVSEFSVPDGWGADYEGLDGPYFFCEQETTVTHPEHGDITIVAGHHVRCRYQRNLDVEQQRERRALD